MPSSTVTQSVHAELLGFCKLRSYDGSQDPVHSPSGLARGLDPGSAWWAWTGGSHTSTHLAQGGSDSGSSGSSTTTGSVLAALLASPAAADLVLWVLLRVHAKLLATRAYRQVMWLCEQQHAVVVAELGAIDASFSSQQAQEVRGRWSGAISFAN